MADQPQQETPCEAILKQLREADKKLICAITTASEVVDLVAEGSSETSSKEMVQKKCQEFLESIEECNATYSRACDSQAGLLIPYAVVGTQNMTWSSSDQAL